MATNIDAFDTSDYPKTHPLHSKENAKTLEKFKDECSSDFEARSISWSCQTDVSRSPPREYQDRTTKEFKAPGFSSYNPNNKIGLQNNNIT